MFGGCSEGAAEVFRRAITGARSAAVHAKRMTIHEFPPSGEMFQFMGD